MHNIQCGEIWGGIQGADLDVVTSGIEACLYSSACNSGKGGDIYYFSVCGGDKLTRIAIADVAGHGEVVSKTSQQLYHSLKKRINSAKSNLVLEDLNAIAIKQGFHAVTTAAIATFSRNNRSLYFSYAGHHPILIRSEGDKHWQRLELPATKKPGDIPLGVTKGLPYQRAAKKMRSGDLMVLYTDGVTEAKNPEGVQFGEAGLIAALEQAEGDIAATKEAILTALQLHAGDALEQDDVTFMVIRIKDSPPSLLSKLLAGFTR